MIRLRLTGNPSHQHDCTACVYLGSCTVDSPDCNGREDYDLYICPKESTVIARWSSEGPEYHSGLEMARSSFEQLPTMVYAGRGAMGTAYALAKINGWEINR